MGDPPFDSSTLTPARRAELAIGLWNSFPDDSTERALTDRQRAELAERAVSVSTLDFVQVGRGSERIASRTSTACWTFSHGRRRAVGILVADNPDR